MRGSRWSAALPDPRRPRPRLASVLVGVLATGLAAGLATGTAHALVPSGDAALSPIYTPTPSPTLTTTTPTTGVPFSTSFETGPVPAVGGTRLSHLQGEAHTGTTYVLTDSPELTVSGLPVAWYDVSAWVRLPDWQPTAGMAWDGALGTEVGDDGWTKVSGHAQAVGGVVRLSFDVLCPQVVPVPWGFKVDDVSLDRSKDQYPYPRPAVKCKNPLPSVPVAHTYDFGQAADLAAFSPDSRNVSLRTISTEPVTQGAWLQADVAVQGYGVRLRGLAPGAYDVTGAIRANLGMGLVEESRSPRDAIHIPGGNVWTPFSMQVVTGEDGSLDFQVSNGCAGGGAAVITTFALKTLTVTPVAEPVTWKPFPGCSTTTPTTTKPTTTKPTKTKSTKTKTTKTRPTKSTKTKSTKTKTTKTKTTKTPPTKTSGTTTSPTSSAPASCMFSYQVTEAWEGGFSAEMSVTSSTDVPYWYISWEFPGDQQVRQYLIGYGSQEGAKVTVMGNGIYPVARAGVPVVVPFVATGDSTGYPTNAALKGLRCYGGK